MVYVPYIPAPYPDEILGSWLARVLLHNGSGAWRTLLETVGFGRRIERPLFDLVDYESKTEHLLNALGVSYERAILEMTTLPYWLVFDSSKDFMSSPAGAIGVPQVRKASGGNVRSIGRIGRCGGRSLRIKYCPLCLDEDHILRGEPYWHREHQLPTVLFCTKHQCALQSTCQHCGRGVSMPAKQLTGLPMWRCNCGHDLRRRGPAGVPPEAYLRLARNSVRALYYGRPTWNAEHVRTYLRSLLSPRHDTRQVAYGSALATAFELERDAGGMLSRPLSELGIRGDRWWLRGYLSNAQAPECCALLTALDIDIDEAARGFQRKR